MTKNDLMKISTTLPTEDAGDWFVLHTKSRQEKIVHADLTAMGIAVFLPLYDVIRTYARNRQKTRKPMFPGYLFLRGTPDDTYRIDRTGRIAGIIQVADQQTLDEELKNLYMAMCKCAPLDPYPFLKEGMKVQVRSGPFKGLQGIVENRDAHDRINLQIDMLGRAMSLELDGAVLEAID